MEALLGPSRPGGIIGVTPTCVAWMWAGGICNLQPSVSSGHLKPIASRSPFCSQGKIMEGEATPSTLNKQVPRNAPFKLPVGVSRPLNEHDPDSSLWAGILILKQHPLLSVGS